MAVEKMTDAANENTGQWSGLSWKGKLKHVIANITVEPILCCYLLPNVLAALTIMNLNLEKACRVNLHYNDSVCDAHSARNSTGIEMEEEKIQEIVVAMNYWQSILRSSLPAVLILFFGSFSDRSGRRKPFMLLPIVGELFTVVGLLLCTYYYYEWPMEVAGVIEALFPALTGGWTTMFMAVFSFMGDITTLEMRTVRLGIVNVFVSIAAPVGIILSGYLYQLIGFYGVFSTVAVLYFLGLIYGQMRLKEAKTPNKLQHGFCKEFLNPTHVTDTFRVAFKKRPGNLRLRVLLIMILSFTIFGPISGEMAVGYLFTRIRFQWNEVDFSLYSTYVIVINLIGTSLGIGLFIHMFKMEDAMLGMVAYTSKLVASIFYAFASTPQIFYIVTLIDMVGGTGLIAMRSIASKLVPSEELGKINSLFGVCEAVVPIVYQPLYSAVYNTTRQTLPGAFFLVGGALNVPTILLFLYLYILQKRDPVGTLVTNNGQEKERDAADAQPKGVHNPTFENDLIIDQTKL
ncbi:solute carrier family 46 member 3 [Cimex lectularius]|uniref:Adenylate cyclase n=1 Tax=Cimex lectularius TaxID=79782 RepID=A0A8I6TJN7_CIMLE|nr:solute carrier family 46 member 3 [Cimex lectularius]